MSSYIPHLRHYPFTLLTATAIVVLSLMPAPHVELAEDVPLADKWTHMAMYGGLCLIIWVEYLRAHLSIKATRIVRFGVLWPVTMGGLLEVMQSTLTTTRSGDVWDFVANTIGVIMGTLIGLLVLNPMVRYRGRRRN